MMDGSATPKAQPEGEGGQKLVSKETVVLINLPKRDSGKASNVVIRGVTANGLLLPFLVFQMYVHPLIWIASLWAVTLPGSTISLALLFRRKLLRELGKSSESIA